MVQIFVVPMIWCRNFRYVKALWYASTAGEDESVWKEIIDDVAKGYVEISRRCISVFAQMLFSACEAYYAGWDDIDKEIVLPQARIPESNGLCTRKIIVPKPLFQTHRTFIFLSNVFNLNYLEKGSIFSFTSFF